MRHLEKALELLEEAPQSADAMALAAEVLSLMLGSGVRAGAVEDGEPLIGSGLADILFYKIVPNG